MKQAVMTAPGVIEFRATVVMITELRADGWSLRQIGVHVGLHFTRVQQLLKQTAPIV